MCQVFISATPKEENYLNLLKIQRHFNYNKLIKSECVLYGFPSKEAVSAFIILLTTDTRFILIIISINGESGTLYIKLNKTLTFFYNTCMESWTVNFTTFFYRIKYFFGKLKLEV